MLSSSGRCVPRGACWSSSVTFLLARAVQQRRRKPSGGRARGARARMALRRCSRCRRRRRRHRRRSVRQAAAATPSRPRPRCRPLHGGRTRQAEQAAERRLRRPTHVRQVRLRENDHLRDLLTRQKTVVRTAMLTNRIRPLTTSLYSLGGHPVFSLRLERSVLGPTEARIISKRCFYTFRTSYDVRGLADVALY